MPQSALVSGSQSDNADITHQSTRETRQKGGPDPMVAIRARGVGLEKVGLEKVVAENVVGGATTGLD